MTIVDIWTVIGFFFIGFIVGCVAGVIAGIWITSVGRQYDKERKPR